MPLKPKHRREIRDLLRVLYDDKAWQPIHTDRLLSIVRATRSDVMDEVETTVARDAAEARRANAAIQAGLRKKLREVDTFRDALKDLHSKVAPLLEALVDLPMMKARVQAEDGSWVIDPTLITDRDAKVGLQAVSQILKVTGALAPTKVEAEVNNGGAFELLDAIEGEG